MKEKLDAIINNAAKRIQQADLLTVLAEVKVQVLGKKGELTQILRGMGALPKEQRPAMGSLVNAAREKIETLIEGKEKELKDKEMEVSFKAEAVDITLPGKNPVYGVVHPLTKVYNQIIDIFLGMGFKIEDGPEVEYDKFNFEMLNMPKDHPARAMHDTFYVDENIVLRTHTSPVQARTMLKEQPPIRILSPGRVYRADSVDATHSPIFNQIEGLVVDKGITMGDLKGVLDVFAKEMYGNVTKTRLRPSYFPFTEPSVEVDISCSVCQGEGCRVCKGTGWIEILGAGMVHPNVLRFGGIDPTVYSGFAFGLGLDRVTNMKYGITDIRLLYENDIRFLHQF